MWAIHQTRNETYLVITLGKAGCVNSKIREIKEGLYKLPGGSSFEWVRPFTRRFQCLFGWDATVEEACKQSDTKKLAKLLPGADAVDTALLPAIAQLGNEPKLLMLEDCPHWMWWDQKKELLKEYETDKDLDGILDATHFPLRARHFFKPCAEGPCANGEMVETQRESRVEWKGGRYPVVEIKHGVSCTLCAKVLCTTCAQPIVALNGRESDTEG